MATTDEILKEIEAALLNDLDAVDYQIGDRRVRKAELRQLMEYEDRMLARKAKENYNYKSHVLVRFNFDR